MYIVVMQARSCRTLYKVEYFFFSVPSLVNVIINIKKVNGTRHLC